VIKFLKYFTFLSRSEIEALEVQLKERPEKREAQRTLAREVTRIVHGDDAVISAENITQALFSGDVRQLSEVELVEALQDMPSTKLENRTEIGLIDLLTETKVAPSRRQAKQDIESGAVYVNGERYNEIDAVVTVEQLLHGKYIVLRRGKKSYHLAEFVR
jgi:tyrosyl-tRNA synthetase